MKTCQRLAALILVACATPSALSQPSEETGTSPAAAPAKAETTKHRRLCAQLGLKVGGRYEFMLTGNEEVHYWEVRSLGANGWILTKDSRYPATWVNLSQVIAITPFHNNAAPETRPVKANRAR